MYDATGVRLHAGRQAEVSLLPPAFLCFIVLIFFNDAFELWYPHLWGLIHFPGSQSDCLRTSCRTSLG